MSEEMPPPGRDRDIEIAKALGFTHLTYKPELSPEYQLRGMIPDSGCTFDYVLQYSTTNACMELLAYVRAQKTLAGEKIYYNLLSCKNDNGAFCQIEDWSMHRTWYEYKGKDEADAISGAFLLWMRARKKA